MTQFTDICVSVTSPRPCFLFPCLQALWCDMQLHFLSPSMSIFSVKSVLSCEEGSHRFLCSDFRAGTEIWDVWLVTEYSTPQWPTLLTKEVNPSLAKPPCGGLSKLRLTSLVQLAIGLQGVQQQNVDTRCCARQGSQWRRQPELEDTPIKHLLTPHNT